MIIALVQARMGSTRLPGKVLMPIMGKPMIWYVVERLKRVAHVDKVVIATSEKNSNDVIRDLCKQYDIDCFSGSENDVLDRFYKAAKEYQADIVIRITADCPLLDPSLIGDMLEEFIRTQRYDYFSVACGAGASTEKFNGHRYPDGLDAEIFKFSILQSAWEEATLPLEREHVTPFIWQNPERFKLGNKQSTIDYSMMRWTVDNREDFEVVESIYNELYPKKKTFGLGDIIEFLSTHPELQEKNFHFIGAEEYAKFFENNEVHHG